MNTRDEIVKLEERINEMDSSSVIDTSHIAKELLHDDCVIVGTEGELFNKEFIVMVHGPKRSPFQSAVVDDSKITVLDDTTVLVNSLATFKKNDNAFTLRFFRVWKKLNSKWQVVGGSTTMVPKE